MSRIRTVKPEFFRHEALFNAEKASGLPLRLAFEGLWIVADREGRFRWQPRVLKLDVLPFDDVDFASVLDALAEHGFVVRYTAGADTFGHIPTWLKHQHVNVREQASTIPTPPTDGAPIIIEPPRSVHAPDENVHAPDKSSGEGEGELEGKDKSHPSDAPANKPKDDVHKAVQVYASIALGAGIGWPAVQRLTAARAAACRARLKEAGGIEGWRAALERASRSSFLCGAGKDGWRADFDFFCQAKSFTKLMEGSYDDHASVNGNGKSRPHDTILGALAKVAQQGAGLGERQAGADDRPDGIAVAAPGNPTPHPDLEIPDYLRRTEPPGNRH